MIEKMENKKEVEEKRIRARGGMGILLLLLLLMVLSIAAVVFGIVFLAKESFVLGGILLGAGILFSCIVGPILFAGLKVLKPNEALVLTLFGKYYGTLTGPGFFYVNPFVTAVNPAAQPTSALQGSTDPGTAALQAAGQAVLSGKKISLKAMTLNNEKQKINDKLGNPIIIGIVVIWRVTNTAKAVFNVDNYKEFLSIQCDSALRNVVRLYPYDISEDDGDGVEEKSLRGSSQEIVDILKEEIQKKVVLAGQWLNPPGGLPGSATAGKFAIQRILKKEGKNFHL